MINIEKQQRKITYKSDGPPVPEVGKTRILTNYQENQKNEKYGSLLVKLQRCYDRASEIEKPIWEKRINAEIERLKKVSKTA